MRSGRLGRSLRDHRGAGRRQRRVRQVDIQDRFHAIRFAHPDRFLIVDRVAGNDAVEERGEFLRHHHALTSASGTADPIRAIGPGAVVLVDQVLRGQRGHLDRLIGLTDDTQWIEEVLVGVSERVGVC